jgi:hypothetical protein
MTSKEAVIRIMAWSSQTILGIMARAVDIYDRQSNYLTLQEELEYVRELTDNEDLIADFFESYYRGHETITYNRETQELHNKAFDYSDDEEN